MTGDYEYQVYFPGGDRIGESAGIVQAMNIAGMRVVYSLDPSIVPEAAVARFHGRGRVAEAIHAALKGLSCPIIGIELNTDGDRNDPIMLFDLHLDADTPAAAIAHAIRKQIGMSRSLSELTGIRQMLEKRRSRLDEVVESGIRLTRTLSHHELFQLVVERISHMVPADLYAFFTIDGNAANCRLRASHQNPSSPVKIKVTPSFRIRSDFRTMLNQMIKPVTVSAPYTDHPSLATIASHFKPAISITLAPFISKGHLLGFIALARTTDTKPYSESDLERLEILAAFSSVALGNAFVYDQAETLSRIDDLTGTYNFGFVQNYLERLISAGERFSLVFIDLDGFKTINLMHGHTTGNRALKQTAAKLRESLMAFCISGRFGGDEFVIVIPGKNTAESRIITEKVIAAIETVVIDAEIRLSASAGIAEFPIDGENLNSIIHAADTAMYEAKNRGRGHAVSFRELKKGNQE